MASKTYRLYCEICNWKKITDGKDVDGLYEYKTSPIPRGVPKKNPVDKKVVTPEPLKQVRKFRCPKCGRVVKAKEMNNPQEKINHYWDEVERKQKMEEWAEEDARFKAEYEAARKLYEEKDQSF